MSRLIKLMIAVAVVAMAIPAFAAVENIKVGGDIDIYGISRNNMYPLYWGWVEGEDNINFFTTSARVYVKAELTDNVEAMVRLINERDWGSHDKDPLQWNDSEHQISLDLAYIKVSDILTPGMALTVGRQEIQLGEGLVVGSRYIPFASYIGGDTWSAAQDLGKQKAFDAVRVDYAAPAVPLDVTAFMTKVNEFYDIYDMNLYGVNLGFNLQDMARLEGYWVRCQEMGDLEENVTTMGIRATGNFSGLGLKGEYARQFGQWDGHENKGWALLLGGEYQMPTEKSAYVKAQFNLYSGDDGSGDNTQWISLFPANVASMVGDINYVLTTTYLVPMGLSNAQVINVGGGIRPVERLGVALDWFNVNFMEEPSWTSDKGVGNEIDASLVYDYTEDLSFGLKYGVLFLGSALEDKIDQRPWQLIASMKIKF